MRKRVLAVQSVLGLLAVVAVMVLAAGPAVAHHKGGHDKGGEKEAQSEDSAKTQGKSPSDPDDDGHGPDRSNGGPDKPGGSGGVDKSDQDGNNGCGNDVDREDDNEGWCGSKPKPAKAAKAKIAKAKVAADIEAEIAADADEDADEAADEEVSAGDEATVEGARVNLGLRARPTVDDSSSPVDASVLSDEVLGTRVTRGSVAGSAAVAAASNDAVLPFTGAQIATFLLIALGLIATGLFLARTRMN